MSIPVKFYFSFLNGKIRYVLYLCGLIFARLNMPVSVHAKRQNQLPAETKTKYPQPGLRRNRGCHPFLPV